MWYLKEIDLFSQLDEEEMERLGDMTHAEDLKAHQTVYFPGDTSDTVFMLKRGRVRISQSSPQGKQHTLAILGPGSIFGEMSLAGEETRRTRAETLEESFICAASKDRFLDFLKDHPEINFRITKMFGDRRREIESKIEQLIFQDASGQLAWVLLDLFEKFSESDDEGESPRIRFSHEELASLVGLTRPTVTHLLNEFQEEGLIDIAHRSLTLQDETGLKKITESS